MRVAPSAARTEVYEGVPDARLLGCALEPLQAQARAAARPGSCSS